VCIAKQPLQFVYELALAGYTGHGAACQTQRYQRREPWAQGGARASP